MKNNWREVKLGDVCNVNMGQSPVSSAYNGNGDGLPLIQGNNDIKNGLTIDRVWTSEITKTAEKGQIILTVRAPVGCVGVSHSKVCLGRGVCAVSSKKEDERFVFYFLKYFELKWRILEQGSTFTAVNGSDIRKLKMKLPPIEEQGRIVRVLECWDGYLEKLGRKIEVKKNIKKALMQKLLTGEKRLAGFSDKWQTVKLGEVCNIERGDMITKKDITDGNVPVIAGGKQPAYFHNKFNYNGKTITVSGSGASAGYINYFNQPIFASDCSVVKEVENRSNIDFIYFSMQNKQDFILALQSGGAQPHVYPKDLQLIKIKLPKLEEQKAIAEILTKADEEITALEKKKEVVEAQKKYLLNNLVTGKILTIGISDKR